MNTYIFKTTATMKPYNSRFWWIEGGIVTEKRVEAETLKAALQLYRERVKYDHYITISNNAISHKSEMFVDGKDREPVQVGYVITGKTEFQRDDGSWSENYIDLWVEILEVKAPAFGEAV